MRPNKNILLTFDYEPYLGKKSGSAKKCVIEPTNALLSIVKKYNAKCVFFVDLLYVSYLKKIPDLHLDFEAIKAQLILLNKNGHFIFPHIHPHWIDSVYIKEEKQFDLSNLSRYSLSMFSVSEINDLFTEAIRLLNDIGISYNAYGYRAGGWCIQPFCNFKDIFLRNNIISEFSVLPGYKNKSMTQAFDFSDVTTNKPYLFSDRVEIPDIKGLFKEFPISTIYCNGSVVLQDKIVKKYLWKTGDRGWGDGISADTASFKSNSNNQEMISIDILTIAKLKLYKSYINKNDYMHWISHPKMFTHHGLYTFEKFLKYCHSHFNVEYDFNKMI
ncbi:MAG: hypothetical protein C0448_05600 [Sphingobacteriaceae bacterium]|nr:hypothetical protein [Sphingobacteriaceae bacterium]